MDPVGELVAAAVVDERVWNAYGDRANDGIYLAGQPGPALPFVIFRAWKVPVGVVSEEIRLIGPSGRTIYRWGPEPRRMAGATTGMARSPHRKRPGQAAQAERYCPDDRNPRLTTERSDDARGISVGPSYPRFD